MAERNLKTLLTSLCTEHHLLSAHMMLVLLEKKGKTFNKTSVYRALDQLVEEGELCKHFFDENEALYELRSHHHAHLICQECGSITEGDCSYSHPKRVGDFQVNHHHLTLVGVCHKCQG